MICRGCLIRVPLKKISLNWCSCGLELVQMFSWALELLQMFSWALELLKMFSCTLKLLKVFSWARTVGACVRLTTLLRPTPTVKSCSRAGWLSFEVFWFWILSLDSLEAFRLHIHFIFSSRLWRRLAKQTKPNKRDSNFYSSCTLTLSFHIDSVLRVYDLLPRSFPQTTPPYILVFSTCNQHI